MPVHIHAASLLAKPSVSGTTLTSHWIVCYKGEHFSSLFKPSTPISLREQIYLLIFSKDQSYCNMHYIQILFQNMLWRVGNPGKKLIPPHLVLCLRIKL